MTRSSPLSEVARLLFIQMRQTICTQVNQLPPHHLLLLVLVLLRRRCLRVSYEACASHLRKALRWSHTRTHLGLLLIIICLWRIASSRNRWRRIAAFLLLEHLRFIRLQCHIRLTTRRGEHASRRSSNVSVVLLRILLRQLTLVVCPLLLLKKLRLLNLLSLKRLLLELLLLLLLLLLHLLLPLNLLYLLLPLELLLLQVKLILLLLRWLLARSQRLRYS